MASHSRWDDVKNARPAPSPANFAAIERNVALGQVLYDLRSAAALSQQDLAERAGITSSVVSRLEEGGGAGTPSGRETLARIAGALDRELAVLLPETAQALRTDAVEVHEGAGATTRQRVEP